MLAMSSWPRPASCTVSHIMCGPSPSALSDTVRFTFLLWVGFTIHPTPPARPSLAPIGHGLRRGTHPFWRSPHSLLEWDWIAQAKGARRMDVPMASRARSTSDFFLCPVLGLNTLTFRELTKNHWSFEVWEGWSTACCELGASSRAWPCPLDPMWWLKACDGQFGLVLGVLWAVSTGIGFKYQKSEPEPPLKILTRNLPNQTKIGTGFEPIQPGFSESENLESPRQGNGNLTPPPCGARSSARRRPS